MLQVWEYGCVVMFQEYQFSVRENERYPTQLGVVVASDRDSGPYGNITYSLEGQGAEFFYIDPLEVNYNMQITTYTSIL